MTAYDDLMAFERQTQALGLIAGRLNWDQETMMPRGATAQRAEEIGALQSVLHARRTDPKIGDWLAAIDDDQLDPVGQAQMRHIRRSYRRTMCIPADLDAAQARLHSVAQGIWAQARGDEDFAAFAPTLTEVLNLKRQEAEALAGDGDLYDALLDDYEPEAKAADLEAMFNALRPALVALREKVLGAAAQPAGLDHAFDEQTQMKLTRKLARTFGYDSNHGRVDKAVHPFSSGSAQDVRITTRTNPADPFNCFYSTIHEVGHGCYEQNIHPDYMFTPLGRGVSMGVHESQSRIYENQLGRGAAFTSWLFEQMKDHFGDFGIKDAEAFYGTVNRVNSGYIRTEADEVHYNLHVLLRFDLERAMIAGDLSVVDLPEAWNSRFEADFGVAVDKPSNGCLQDVHWSVGLFGYFPTYSLGNVYAGCLYQAMRTALPDLEQQLRAGDTSAATGWLRENVQVHGGLYKPREVIERACGFAPSEAPLLTYLEEKFSGIYGL
ncbi:MAG: carboxypeptidase M32 [Rhodobacterales bacterium]|nr:MAG: carboxypeptidase M32 [Rhodobacterales bacterium]